MRVGKGIGEGKYNRCVFIRGNNNNKEGRDEEGMGDGNDFTTTPTPKVMILFIIQLIYLLTTLSSPKRLRHRMPSHNIFMFFINIPLPTILSPNDRLSPARWLHPLSLLSFSPPIFWLVVVCVLIEWRTSVK